MQRYPISSSMWKRDPARNPIMPLLTWFMTISPRQDAYPLSISSIRATCRSSSSFVLTRNMGLS